MSVSTKGLRYTACCAIFCLFAGACASLAPVPSAEVQRTLAPSGKLRVGFNFGAPSSVVRDANTGELSGLEYDLGKEFARRLGVPFEPVLLKRSAEIIDALKAGSIDLGFLTLTPARMRELDFSIPHVRIDQTFLVPANSNAQTLADLDRSGTRVATLAGGTSSIVLKQRLKNATVVDATSIPGGVDLLRTQQIQAFGTQKTTLSEMARQLPGSRLLDGYFASEDHAMAIPKGRDAGKNFVEAFVLNARSSGLIKALVEKNGLRGTLSVPD